MGKDGGMKAERRELFHWRTSISYKTVDKVVVRGYDLSELARHIDFGEHCYLLWRGQLPTSNEGKMMNALFVWNAEHAFSPSTVAARMVAAGRAPLPTCVAAGIAAFGEAHEPVYHCARLLQDYVRRGEMEKKGLGEMAEAWVKENAIVFGLHHPQHISGDPRALHVLKLAEELGLARQHCHLLKALEDAYEKRRGRRLRINEAGATAAVLSDMGFTPSAAWAAMFVARAAGCAAHAMEEMEREALGRADIAAPTMSLLDLPLQSPEYYDGPPDRHLPQNR